MLFDNLNRYGLRSPRSGWFYTGKVGADWLSPNVADAMGFTKAEAERKKEVLLCFVDYDVVDLVEIHNK